MRAHEYGLLSGPSKSRNMNDWALTLFSDFSDLDRHLQTALNSDADSFYLLGYHPTTEPISKVANYNVRGAGRVWLIPPDVEQASLTFDLWPPSPKQDTRDRVKVHKYGLLAGNPKAKDYHEWWLSLFSDRDDLDEHLQTAANSEFESFIVFEHDPTTEPTSKVVHYRVIQIGRLDKDSEETDISLNG
jgi:hypothetical protein